MQFAPNRLPLWFVLSFVLALAPACAGSAAPGIDADGSTSTQDIPEKDQDSLNLPLPEFAVEIVASKTLGNSPLDVNFSVEVSGNVQPYDLTYAWKIGENVSYTEMTFDHTFYQKGNHQVQLTAIYQTGDGRSKSVESEVSVSVSGCADLRFDQLSLALPVEVAPGDTVTLKQGKLYNEGDRIRDPFNLAIYVSKNEIFEPEKDVKVAQWEFEGMDSGIFGESSEDLADGTFVVPEDLAEGLYFVFWVADPDGVVNECQEDNNVAACTNNLTVDDAVALKADLTITDIGFADALVVNEGDNVNYHFRVQNVGEGEATKFGLGFWLSTDKTLDPETDIKMFGPDDLGATMQQMAAGGSQNFYKSFKTPEGLPDGDYWMIGQVDVDGQVYEEDEANNVSVSAVTLTMEYKQEYCYDLAIDSYELSPLASYWKGTVIAKLVVSNPGTVITPAAWNLKAFISLQASLNPATATQVGSWNFPPIPPGESTTLEQVISIPNGLPVQPHYIGLVIDLDGELSECAEGNNSAMYPEPVKITSQATIDVGVAGVSYHPKTVNAGESIKLSYALSNTGSSNATAFKVAVVLSEDPSVTFNSVKNGTDLIVHEAGVASVPALGSVVRVDEVLIPIELPHELKSYYVGVVVDRDSNLKLDTKKGNNIALAPEILTVEGAQGGCFEDEQEPNNTKSKAAVIDGSLEGLGSCGNEDWYKVTGSAGHSMVVTLKTAALLGLEPVNSDIDLQLLDANVLVLSESTNTGNAETVHVFNLAEESTFYLRVYPKAPGAMASYDLDVNMMEPVDGIDLLGVDVQASPKSLYPGGLMNVSWKAVNIGNQTAAQHKVRLWASKDTELDPAADILLGLFDGASVAPSSTVLGSETFLLPADIPGGSWRFLVEVDAEGQVVEANEENNTGFSDIVFLDPLLTCEDDGLEPNNELSMATPLTLKNGVANVNKAVACPSLDDWYSFDVEVGTLLSVKASYDHKNNKGLLGVELWDVTKTALLLTASNPNDSLVQIPWVWSGGTYYVRVHSVPSGGKVGPYEYNLVISSGPGSAENKCVGDVFEDNNSLSVAQYIGCGLQEATLCKGDIDVYRIELDAWDPLVVTLQHSAAQLKMSLYKSLGGNVAVSKKGNGKLNYQATQDETVYLVVESHVAPDKLTDVHYSLFLDGVTGVDLMVEQPSLYLGEVYQGEDALLDFGVTNTCVDPAAAFMTTVWLSQDDTLDEGDAPVAEISMAGVGSKSTVEMSEKITVPFSTQPGMYYLIVDADSGGVVGESNEDNNANSIGLAVAKLCLPDAYEPNDVLSPGSPFAPLLTQEGAEGLALCPFELDYFSIQVPAGATLKVHALFSHQEGDLDLRLYDTSYSKTIPVKVAGSKDDNELIEHDVPVDGEYIIRINGFDGSSASYDLVVTFE